MLPNKQDFKSALNPALLKIMFIVRKVCFHSLKPPLLCFMNYDKPHSHVQEEFVFMSSGQSITKNFIKPSSRNSFSVDFGN